MTFSLGFALCSFEQFANCARVRVWYRVSEECLLGLGMFLWTFLSFSQTSHLLLRAGERNRCKYRSPRKAQWRCPTSSPGASPPVQGRRLKVHRFGLLSCVQVSLACFPLTNRSMGHLAGRFCHRSTPPELRFAHAWAPQLKPYSGTPRSVHLLQVPLVRLEEVRQLHPVRPLQELVTVLDVNGLPELPVLVPLGSNFRQKLQNLSGSFA